MSLVLVLCFLVLTGVLTDGANILILHPIYSGSHEHVLRNVGEHLVQNRGHNVTQIRYQFSEMKSQDESAVHVKTYKIQDPEKKCSGYINPHGEFDIGIKGAKLLWDYGHTFYGLPTDMTCLTDVHCETLYNSNAIYELINSTTFDLVIVDLIANECSLALAKSLGIPIVGYWGFSFHGGEVMYSSVFNPSSVIPGFFSGFTSKMDFFERVTNFVLYIGHRLFMMKQAGTAEKYIREKYPDFLPVSKLVHDVDLTLVNSNFFVDCPRLVSPDIKYVGGLHLKEGNLSKEYEDFVESAEHGVVLFSLGCTGFSPKDFPSEVMRSFISAFARLEQKVVMRFDQKFLPFVPDNVMVANWVPQQELLAHPNVVAFVSHCGMGSILEALYHKVPIIAVGIFGDQLDNAARIAENGLGVRLSKSDLSEENIFQAIKEVMENKSYLKKVSRLSRIWRQQPSTPLEETTFWLEQLLEHGSLNHLKMDDHDLNLLQYFSVDVITFLASLSLFAILGFIKALRIIFRRIITKKQAMIKLKSK